MFVDKMTIIKMTVYKNDYKQNEFRQKALWTLKSMDCRQK